MLKLQPRKAWGQNFLTDPNIARLIVKAADLTSRDVVLEIGAGLGALTELLLAEAGRVVAVERDRRLAAYLREHFPSLYVLVEDARKLDFSRISISTLRYKLVANLPYCIATQFLLHLIERGPHPAKIVVTVQREVGERLAASSGSKAYGVASILSQLFYSVRIVHRISPSCFWPPPKVESVVVAMDWFPHPRLIQKRAGEVMHVVQDAFTQRRKMLRRLFPEATLLTAGISPTARPERVSVGQWIQLAQQ